jgi:hypothetical protein
VREKTLVVVLMMILVAIMHSHADGDDGDDGGVFTLSFKTAPQRRKWDELTSNEQAWIERLHSG